MPLDPFASALIALLASAAMAAGLYAAAARQPGGFLQGLFGFPQYGYPGQGHAGMQGPGAYRTLCVRTCDGYYFPISYATRAGNFQTDQQVCQQMCPGTEVVLYAHRNPGQDSGDAVSTVDRTPYRQLATAFAYRTSYNSSCSCGKATALDLVAGGYSAVTTPGGLQPLGEPLPPLPFARPSPGEDPETLANRKGLLDAGPIAAQRALCFS